MELKRLVPWAAAAAGLAFLFWPRTGKAAEAGTTARVNDNALGGVITRSAPALGAAIVSHSARNGTTIQVLATGITPTDGSGGEWWRIVAPDGQTGFVRAIDPNGNIRNFTMNAPA